MRTEPGDKRTVGEQLDLLSYPHVPFVKGSDTSMAAANSIEPHTMSLREKVLELIADRGSWGATDQEIQAILVMEGSTQRPRRRELQLSGLIKDSGMRRPGRSGKEMIVWVVAT